MLGGPAGLLDGALRDRERRGQLLTCSQQVPDGVGSDHEVGVLPPRPSTLHEPCVDQAAEVRGHQALLQTRLLQALTDAVLALEQAAQEGQAHGVADRLGHVARQPVLRGPGSGTAWSSWERRSGPRGQETPRCGGPGRASPADSVRWCNTLRCWSRRVGHRARRTGRRPSGRPARCTCPPLRRPAPVPGRPCAPRRGVQLTPVRCRRRTDRPAVAPAGTATTGGSAGMPAPAGSS